MKKILITGGAGFIGSHLCRLFVNKYPNYRIKFANGGDRNNKSTPESLFCEKNSIETLWGIGGENKGIRHIPRRDGHCSPIELWIAGHGLAWRRPIKHNRCKSL